MRRVAILAALALTAAAPPNPSAQITTIEVRLFHPNTGQFSANLLDEKLFASTWNVIFGGSVGERADDALVQVGIRRTAPLGNEISSEAPIEIAEVTVSDGKRILARRTVTDIWVPATGQTWVPLWIPDVTCAGDVTITARAGRETKTALVQFRCGE